MTGRLKDKVAIIVGAGQTPGTTIGNGRATAIRFAEEGAAVFLVDRRLDSAEDTLAMVRERGGVGIAHQADVTSEAAVCGNSFRRCALRFGRVDILHNNVGIGAGDRGPANMTEEVWDRIHTTNLKSVMFTCKHALPVMRRAAQRRDRKYFIDRRRMFGRDHCVQDVESGGQRLHAVVGAWQRRIQHPRQRDHAGSHEYPDGNRRQRRSGPRPGHRHCAT